MWLETTNTVGRGLSTSKVHARTVTGTKARNLRAGSAGTGGTTGMPLYLCTRNMYILLGTCITLDGSTVLSTPLVDK